MSGYQGASKKLLMGASQNGKILSVAYLRVQFWAPYVFVILVNSIENDINSKVLKFADDTRVVRVVRVR